MRKIEVKSKLKSIVVIISCIVLISGCGTNEAISLMNQESVIYVSESAQKDANTGKLGFTVYKDLITDSLTKMYDNRFKFLRMNENYNIEVETDSKIEITVDADRMSIDFWHITFGFNEKAAISDYTITLLDYYADDISLIAKTYNCEYSPSIIKSNTGDLDDIKKVLLYINSKIKYKGNKKPAILRELGKEITIILKDNEIGTIIAPFTDEDIENFINLCKIKQQNKDKLEIIERDISKEGIILK